jgi:uncharacterized protein (DUF983 family)
MRLTRRGRVVGFLALQAGTAAAFVWGVPAWAHLVIAITN